jgi:hypothetical protein
VLAESQILLSGVIIFFTKNYPLFSGTGQNVNVTNVVALVLLGVCWLSVKYFHQVLYFFYKKHPLFGGTGQNVNVTNVVALVLLKKCRLKVKYFYPLMTDTQSQERLPSHISCAETLAQTTFVRTTILSDRQIERENVRRRLTGRLKIEKDRQRDYRTRIFRPTERKKNRN